MHLFKLFSCISTSDFAFFTHAKNQISQTFIKPMGMEKFISFMCGLYVDCFVSLVHKGSNMSAHVLLNLLYKLRKRDKMRGIPSILSLFRKEFNKFNNSGARMLDSVGHMTIKLFCNHLSIIIILI